MKRREFITLLGGAAAGWPLAARGQHPGKLPTIGFLGTTDPSVMRPWITAFVERLRDLGWIEDRTIAIAYRWAEGHPERYAEIAAEFVRLNVNVIVTTGPAAPQAKKATSVIPIVLALSGDPVGAGLVLEIERLDQIVIGSAAKSADAIVHAASRSEDQNGYWIFAMPNFSLAQPGGNITGLSMQWPDAAGKRLELLREVVPSFRRLAIMVNVGFPDAVLDASEAQAAAQSLGLEIATLEIRRAGDIVPAFESLKDHADALYVTADALLNANRIRINTLALGARLPTMHAFRESVEAGGLMSYGPNLASMFRRAAELADRILRGTKPGDIPVEQPTKFDLVVNLITARALGLTIPPTLLARADEVIE